ncbi:hypothetical protein [Mitsuaria sp. 7]|uniref:hypothetical protein n=1 Tax=Mitsuaria sp. 7 TaxID=1658665 RepID=UPI0012F7777C|nr:hypothetical protein [Mitsuaria sp. 7]
MLSASPAVQAANPSLRFGLALRVAITAALVLSALAAEASSNAWPAPPRPVASVGLAPRGMLFAPSSATAGNPVVEEDSDEQFRAQAEAEVLRRLGVAARRDDLRLWLPVAKGRPVVLDSQRSDPADPAASSIDFRLDGLSPDGQFYVVRATLTAGSELLWISRADGTRYEMHGNVNPSPDGRYLVVTHASPGVEFNGVVLWSLEDGRLVERYRFQPTTDQTAISFRFMRWRDADTVELAQFAEVDATTCDLGTLSSTALLSRKAERWILRSASGQHCDR